MGFVGGGALGVGGKGGGKCGSGPWIVPGRGAGGYGGWLWDKFGFGDASESGESESSILKFFYWNYIFKKCW